VNHLLSQGIPLDLAQMTNKINKHDRNLSMIGILPNQLRTLLKENNGKNCDIAFEDISKELFWQGYRIWQSRNKLMADFWKNIAPDNWKLYQKTTKTPKKLREIKVAEQCVNPFHFLKRNKNLSKQRPTMCSCSQIQTSHAYKFRDISSFFSSTRTEDSVPSNVRENVHHNVRVMSLQPQKKIALYETREDHIRGARSAFSLSSFDNNFGYTIHYLRLRIYILCTYYYMSV